MNNKHDIICISSIDWDFIWQGHQEVMSAFARGGNRVLFIENTGIRTPGFKDMRRMHKRIVNWFKSVKGFRKESDNLFIYSPLVLPFPYSRLARWINKYLLIRPLERWMKVMKFRDPVVWTFLPTGTALDIMNNIDCKLLVYYCIADFSALVANPKKVERTENELIAKCDIIFAQGTLLRDKCLRLNNRVHIFPFGVNIRVFREFLAANRQPPADMKDIKKPVVGYVGGIHRHIDFGLLEAVAREHPEWSFVLVGPVQDDVSAISDLENVFLLGKKDFSELPVYINEFDAAIIPYRKSEYTDTVYPTKLNEYHAMGKPVISTDLSEIRNFNVRHDDLVAIGSTSVEFGAHIARALKNDSQQLAQARRAAAEKNNWDQRIEKMNDLIEQAIRSRAAGPADWREKFTALYRSTRHKIVKISLLAALAYFLVFYTPLVWMAAAPLKVAHAPQKADAIVVFAGGVGESGHAGQGYEERVKYAVDLFKAGYAQHLVFSSGYTYAFSETAVMKALAVSLGVPEGAVILEDRACNTYENVLFTRHILDREKWTDILLVSSPYHMRRATDVFARIAPEIKVVPTPIPVSLFYASENEGKWRGIKLYQISGILHEYAGLIYYYFKGYI